VSRRRAVAAFLALGLASACAPATMDMNLPALPTIARDFHVPVSATQLMLTVFLVGMALGQLVFGPLSDVFGRRRPLVAGLVIYSAASVWCACASSIEALVAARLLAGFGGSSAIVTARAVVRDMYEGRRAAQYLSRLTLVVAVAPVLAPTIGAQLMRATSWRGLFWVLSGFGVAVIAAFVAAVPQRPIEIRYANGMASTLAALRRLFRDQRFMGFAVALAFANMTVTIYIAGSPFVLHDRYGLSPQSLAIVFGINAVGLIAGSQVNALLVRRLSVERILRSATIASVTVSCALVALALDHAPVVPVVTCFFFTFTAWGFTASNLIALAMADHPADAGSAAAFLGVAQWGVGGLLTPLVGLGGGAALLPMAGGMLACSCLGVGALRALAGVRQPELASL
jgi:MFS transporter, DHA1 family, multidrug resistance protein